MRIENTSMQPGGSSSPIDKLRRSATPAEGTFENTLEDLDLSFMDLLGSIIAESPLNTPQTTTLDKIPEKDKGTTKPAAKENEASHKLTLVAKASAPAKDEPMDDVDHDMVLLKDALTETDIQYMKQAVIPGLPILMGSVPTGSVFPTSEDGEISYRGFEVSPKLAELIEKGYRSGRPIRVELDPDSAVVLKIRNGQVSAQFVSTDKNAGAMMQQSLDDLRNRMLARNLPVGQLEYQYRDPGQQQQRKDDTEESKESNPAE
jgi:hypothetical protein